MKFLYKFFLLVGFAGVAMEQNIEKNMQVFLKTHDFNGVVAVAKDGKMIYAQGFGVADPITQRPNTPETQFFIGSVTKQFTAAAVLKALYDQNPSLAAVKDQLQRPISTFLPENDSIWSGAMPEWANTVTLHHLLTHTSGIFNYTEVDDFLDNLAKTLSPSDLADLFKNKPLAFASGSDGSYCNSGYFLLGEIVQRLSGKSLGAYFKEHFFDPLGMTSSFLLESGNGKDMANSGAYPNLARGTNCGTENGASLVELETYWENSWMRGAGGIVSTAPDLVLWTTALFEHRVLPKDVTDLMLTPHVETKFKPGTFCCYGIIKEGKTFWHTGGLFGFSSNLFFSPSAKLTFVTLNNVQVGKKEHIRASTKLYKDFVHLKNFQERIEACMKVAEIQFPGCLEAQKKRASPAFSEVVNNGANDKMV